MSEKMKNDFELMEEACDKCCDEVGYYDVVGEVFQWLINNGYTLKKSA